MLEVHRHGEQTDPYRRTCDEVADGVFAYISGAGGPNAAFVVGAESVLLIDTLMTPRMSHDLAVAIRRVTPKPVRMVVYTHHHGDHTFGNERFASPALTVGHSLCRARLEELGQEYIPLFASWRRTPEDHEATLSVGRVVYPDITFQQELTLYLEDLQVQLRYLGPAHTTNDIVAFLPQRDVVVTGDLVSYRAVPGMRDANSAGWIERLGELEALPGRTIVPGHGGVTEDRSIISEQRGLLAALWSASQEGYRQGRSASDVLASVDLSPWEHFRGIQRVHEVVEHMFEELEGVPPYDTSAFRTGQDAAGGQRLSP